MIGIIIILMEVLISRNVNCDRKSSCALALSVITALSLMTVNYTKHFQDRNHFWTNAQTNATRAADPYYQLGYSAYLSGDLNRAESYYKTAMSLSSGRPIQQINYLLNLSQVYGEKGMMAEAEEYAKRVIALVPEDPKSARAYSNLGSAYYNQKRVSEAEESYKKAMSLDPRLTDPYYNLCVLDYQQKNDFTEAERYCNKVVELKNNDTRAKISLIIIYYNQQRFKDAIRLANELQEQGVDIDQAIPGMLKALEPYRY